MEVQTIIKSNWLTNKPASSKRRQSFNLTLFLCFVFLVSTLSYLQFLLDANVWMPASGEMVFQKHEYWRLWTTLFAHSDLGHVLSNLLLFFPFSYFLMSYFGFLFFPVVGLVIGGLINYFVLMTMPESVSVIGVSGVVYWMGAAWITLSLLIDRRGSFQKRLIKTIGISAMLFFPQTYKPEISYLSHLLGYAFGIVSALVFYYFNRQKFKSAEVIEVIVEEPDESMPEATYTH